MAENESGKFRTSLSIKERTGYTCHFVWTEIPLFYCNNSNWFTVVSLQNRLQETSLY